LTVLNRDLRIFSAFKFSVVFPKVPLMRVEPESQTKLLDATLNLEGVLLAKVPGAGGFDALCCYFERFKQQCDKNMELTQCSCPSG
ncbi:hypothetical protein HN873_001635, partial [Arachis hypogaea]